MNSQPILRFAPSPNGQLHLGHAYSALLNQKIARDNNGKFLLRIENIDTVRCTPELENQMLSDLEWLGLEWDEAPVRQSERFDIYAGALSRLRARDLLYPAFMSRKEQQQWILNRADQEVDWPSDPDGSQIYPPMDKSLPPDAVADRLEHGTPFAERLDMDKVTSLAGKEMNWQEFEAGALEKLKLVSGNVEDWGDVVLSRKDTPTSYHLSCVLDDAAQGITHIVRGMDLFRSTEVHRLLQILLKLPEPVYHHHRLLRNEEGEKLSKSKRHTALRDLRCKKVPPREIRQMLGFE